MSETRVNTNTSGDQAEPQVIQLANGNHLVAWAHGGQTVGQLFAASGAPIGGNLVLTSGRSPADFSVTPLADGGFLTAWASVPASGSTGDIAVQRFDAGGAPVGAAVRVASSPTDDSAPAVTALDGGGFAVAWVEKTEGSFQTELKLQLFGANGAPAGAAVVVDTFQLSGAGSVQLYPRDPSIAQLEGGEIVLAWAKSGYGYHGYVEGKVLIQRFGEDGQALGSRIESHIHDPNRAQTVWQPSLVATADGGFAVGWSQQGGYMPAQPTSYSAVVRKYAADGTIEGHWSTDVADWRSSLDLTARADGGFTVAYSGSSTSEVYLQAFDSKALPVGEAVLVNSTTAGVQDEPDLAFLADGGHLVAWRSSDGDGGGIYAAKVGGGAAEDQVINSPGPGSTLTGGWGDDTLNASQGPDQLTGGGGADVFAWAKEPWSPAKVTDFRLGEDRLDISALLQAAGYAGSDPVADKYVSFVHVPGGTGVLFDRDGEGSGQQWGNYIINLQGVYPYQVTWAQLSGGASPPVFSLAGTVRSPEGNSGLTSFTYTVTRSGSTADAGAVNWSVAGAGPTPASSADFSGGVNGGYPAGRVEFAPGETTKTFTVSVMGDTAFEPDEGFTVQLISSTGGSIGRAGELTATIVNDDSSDPPPSGEGQVINSPGPGSTLTGGDGDDTLNASRGSDVLTGGGGADVFAWAQEPWSPATVTDFTLGVDRLDFSALFRAAGYTGSDPVGDGYIWLMDDANATRILFDRDGHGPEPQWPNYVLKLEGVSVDGLTWGELTGAEPGTPPPTRLSLSTGPFSAAEGDSGVTPLNFGVHRSGDLSGTSTVEWSVGPGSGSSASGGDFSGGAFGSGTLTFAPGEDFKLIVVQIAGDTVLEADETFSVTIRNASGATIENAASSGTIRNDDHTPPPGGEGQVLTSDQYADTLVGGSGNDTLNAGRGPDQLTGAGGADRFVWADPPWNAGHVTDFTPGADVLDLSRLLAGYSGSNPVADGYVEFRAAGGSTQVYVDIDGPGRGDWPWLVTTLDGVAPSQIGSGDWVFR